MDVARGFERVAQRADAAVHHVGGRYYICTCFRMRQALPHERGDRHVVHDVPGRVDDAVLAVGGEGIERDVGHDAEFRHGLLDRAHGTLCQAIGVPGFTAIEALDLERRDREEGECRDAEARDGFSLADQFIHRHALDARHRRDRHALPGAFHDEHRVDEVVRRQHRLPHHAAREGVAAHAAHADTRELAGGVGVGHGGGCFFDRNPDFIPERGRPRKGRKSRNGGGRIRA